MQVRGLPCHVIRSACAAALEGIQVDGGSESKAAFEDACQPKQIKPFQLPPKRSPLNGAVERRDGEATVLRHSRPARAGAPPSHMS